MDSCCPVRDLQHTQFSRIHSDWSFNPNMVEQSENEYHKDPESLAFGFSECHTQASGDIRHSLRNNTKGASILDVFEFRQRRQWKVHLRRVPSVRARNHRVAASGGSLRHQTVGVAATE